MIADARKSALLNEIRRSFGQLPILPLRATSGQSVFKCHHSAYRLTVWDLSGSAAFRGGWHYYYEDVDAIIFVIDASNPETFDENLEVLQQLSNHNDLRYAPFYICCNKKDIEGAEEPINILTRMNLDDVMGTWHHFTVQATQLDVCEEDRLRMEEQLEQHRKAQAAARLEGGWGASNKATSSDKKADPDFLYEKGPGADSVQDILHWLQNVFSRDDLSRRRRAYRSSLKSAAASATTVVEDV